MTSLESNLLIGLMLLFVAFCIAGTFYGGCLAWFNPDRLRRFEIKVAGLIPTMRPPEDRVNEIKSNNWLVVRRLTTTAASLAFIYLAVMVVSALLTKR
jgi:hypothetical protein